MTSILPVCKSCLKSDNAPKRNLKVQFSQACSIILIPSTSEYMDAGIFLWWSAGDMRAFKQQAMLEKHRKLSAEIASSILVVSDNHERKIMLASSLSTLVESNMKFKGCRVEEVVSILSRFKQRFAAIVIDMEESTSSATTRTVKHLYPKATQTVLYSNTSNYHLTHVDLADVDNMKPHSDAVILSSNKARYFKTGLLCSLR